MSTLYHLTRLTLLASALLLAACNQKDAPKPQATEQDQAAEAMMKELKTEPVKSFPKTADDQHDIAVLDDYEQRMQSLNDEIETEMAQMRAEGNLSDDIVQQRQRDHVQGALALLKSLELKTEQGRYIQGLMYKYWEQQDKLLSTPESEPASQQDAQETVKGLGQYIQAQEQLDHWRNQYTTAQAKN